MLESRRKCEAQRLKEMEESPEWQAQLRKVEKEDRGTHPHRDTPPNPASRHQKWKKIVRLTSAWAARNPTHTTVRGVTAVDATKEEAMDASGG